jgi:hypothetical protein
MRGHLILPFHRDLGDAAGEDRMVGILGVSVGVLSGYDFDK